MRGPGSFAIADRDDYPDEVLGDGSALDLIRHADQLAQPTEQTEGHLRRTRRAEQDLEAAPLAAHTRLV
jgi:hypothetical protein